MNRPTSLTFFAWYLILASLYSLVFVAMHAARLESTQMMQTKLLPPAMSMVLGVLGDLVAITAAVAILKGRIWGRNLCMTLLVAELGLWWWNNAYGPGIVLLIGSIAMLAVLAFATWVFYREPANTYFSSEIPPALPGTAPSSSHPSP